MSYNGWSNYETWAAALWIDNEEGSHLRQREMTREVHEEEEQFISGTTVKNEKRHILAERLCAWVEEEMTPDLGATLAADLFNAAWSAVDWTEIAEHYLADIDDE